MTISSMYPVIATKDVARLAGFYREAFNLTTAFESDWYVHLTAGDGTSGGTGAGPGNIAIIAEGHDTIPEGHRGVAAPRLMNIETDDVDALYDAIKACGAPVLQELRDEAFGQRHFIMQDPDGNLVDVIKLIPPSAEFAAQYSQAAVPQ